MRRAIRPNEAVSEVIVRAVADATGRDPLDLEPFATATDPDAIDSIFGRSSTASPRSLKLRYEGCRVTVTPEAVRVEEVTNQ